MHNIHVFLLVMFNRIFLFLTSVKMRACDNNTVYGLRVWFEWLFLTELKYTCSIMTSYNTSG